MANGIVEGIYMIKVAKAVSAGVCMAIGGIGAAIGQGMVGAKVCESIGKNPSCAKDIFYPSLMSMVIIETSTIFALVVSLMLLLNEIA